MTKDEVGRHNAGFREGAFRLGISESQSEHSISGSERISLFEASIRRDCYVGTLQKIRLTAADRVLAVSRSQISQFYLIS
jgi:hypothetical protein